MHHPAPQRARLGTFVRQAHQTPPQMWASLGASTANSIHLHLEAPFSLFCFAFIALPSETHLYLHATTDKRSTT
jgi:hypothetical protein